MPKTITITEAPDSQDNATTILLSRQGGVLFVTVTLLTDQPPPGDRLVRRFAANDVTPAAAGITNAQRNAYFLALRDHARALEGL